MGQFAVIGLGRFGRAVVRNLVSVGEAVLAIDKDRGRLEQVSAEVDSVALADTTSEAAVAALNLERMTAVVVAIGSRATEASALTTAILKELEIPYIVARAFDDRHARLLRAVGAHEVLNPEDEMGRRLAFRLAHPTVIDQIVVGEGVLAEIEVPESFVGQRLSELDLRNRFGVTLVAIHRGDRTQVEPSPEEVLESGDVLVLLGDREIIERLAEKR